MRPAGGDAMRVEVRRKAFGDSVILRDVAFEVGEGETLALFGASGIGKSTLLRIVAGLDVGFDGAIVGAGRLAMVFQEPTLLPWRSLIANLTLTAHCSEAKARHLLGQVGLADAAERFPTTISLGQARRVALARAFAAEPDTLLLDEAFASLDRGFAQQMQALLLDLLGRHRTRTLIVTHEAEEAARLADRVLLLGGRPARIVDAIEFSGAPGSRDPAAIEAGTQALRRLAESA